MQQTLTESVAERLRSRIAAGRRDVDWKLPAERQLAGQLGVSRVTIRRGLKALCREGLLIARHGSGYYPAAVMEEPDELGRRRTIVFYYADESGAAILDPSDSQVLNGANAEACRLGLNLFSMSRTPVDFMRALGNGLAGDLRGVLLDWAAYSLADSLRRDGIPFVLLEEEIEEGNGACVIQDNAGGTTRALAHLFERGHRRLGIVANRSTHVHARERLAAYEAFVKEHDLPRVQEWIATVPTGKGELGISALLDAPERPTAVFVAAEGLLPGALRELERRGLRCPRDISLVAWGGSRTHASDFAALPITSVWWSSEEMGRMAVDVLQRIVRGEARGRHVLRVATELVDRGSVRDTRSGAASGSGTHAESRTNERMRSR